MRILFDSSLVGSPASFVWDDGSISIGDDAPVDWRFSVDGPRAGCIRAASEAAGCNLVIEPKIPQAAFWKRHTEHPAWHRIIPRGQFGKHLAAQVDRVVEFIKEPQNRYFTGIFQAQQVLIDSLCPGRVKDSSLSDHGFIPDKSGYVPVPIYDNAHSATGRMSITSGPRILTLQRELRSNLISGWDDGQLVEIDFNALEARVINWLAGNEAPGDDAYSWIGKKANAENVPRKVIKEATLAAIYGMTRKNFALRYQDIPDAVDVYESVRKLLRVQELESRLRVSERFTNAFDRPLPQTTAWVSYHVQSSAVDIACGGFKWLVDRLSADWAIPIYLIHDAIILDVKTSKLDKLNEICGQGLRIDIIDQHFPVKVRSFNHD